jgi:hypothetical protein
MRRSRRSRPGCHTVVRSSGLIVSAGPNSSCPLSQRLPRAAVRQHRVDFGDLGGRPVELGDGVPDHRESTVGGLVELLWQPHGSAGAVNHHGVPLDHLQGARQPLVAGDVEGPDERGEQQAAVRAGCVHWMQVAAAPVGDGERLDAYLAHDGVVEGDR